MCGTEGIGTPTLPSSVSPQAPPFSPITPQTSLTTEPECSPYGTSTSLDTENITTPCLPIATSSPKSQSSILNEWTGFKIVRDNIDMNLHPRHQTFNRQTQSIHYVNAYAVRDRLDFSGLKETLPTVQLSIDKLIPTECDRTSIMANFVVLAGRILWESIPALQKIPNIVTDHIKHSHYKEVSSKSQIVSIIVYLKV